MAQLRDGTPIPAMPLQMLPLRSGVLFPGTQLRLELGRDRSRALAKTLRPGDIIALCTQKDPKTQAPRRAHLYDTGTFARVLSIVQIAEDRFGLEVTGLDPFTLETVEGDRPFWRVTARPIVEKPPSDPQVGHLLAQALQQQLERISHENDGALADFPRPDDDPGSFAFRIAEHIGLPAENAVKLLAEADPTERLRAVIKLISEAETRAQLKQKITQQVRDEFGKSRREAVLREQLRAIKQELGETEEDETEALDRRLDEAHLPEEVNTIARRELRRLAALGGQSSEANVVRTYLDWLASMPWDKRADVNMDLSKTRQQLDADHYGLKDVKKRILEHMAVQKLAGHGKGTILCLVGPPGVGKTSLGQSIADATGRPFLRVALGGVRDEAEIRGHRRTYVGAIPGRLIHGLRKVGVKNPVVLLDEIDKLQAGVQGSPEAALLEVLDPEQNHTFTDHYLEAPFDLSEVLFICTANGLEGISAPLRDRMEIVEISGYTEQEKLQIARRHLIPKRMEDSGISEAGLRLSDSALRLIVGGYTRESGVRQLNREIRRIARALALRIADGEELGDQELDVGDLDVEQYLGKPKFQRESREQESRAGIATGLAWTPFGGDILFIETSRMAGKGQLLITGQLGDVMKESAHAALTYFRSHAAELGSSDLNLDRWDLHIHVPAGAVPKDGPSAGVTIFTALVSLLTGRPIRSDTAMTGECSLRGRVLPVGGIKAKVLAAHRAGLRRVILPCQNERDLDEVPEEVLADLQIVFADNMREVLAAALDVTAHSAEPPDPTLKPSNTNGEIAAA